MKPEKAVRYAREVATYERHRAKLERKYPGRIALLHGDELLGVYRTLGEAVAPVLKRFGGPEQCLWQEIGQPVDPTAFWGVDPFEDLPPPGPPFEVQFAKELATYERHRAELERDHWGKFAIIRGDKVVAVFKDEREAIEEGHRLFGLGNFMLPEIGDPVLYFPNCASPDGPTE